MDNTILKIDNISKSFPRVKANKKISFNIERNTVHALLGENGAGKSTFVKVLYGLLKPDDGVIYFTEGETLEKTPEGITLDELGLTKICCRRHMLTHVDIE